MILFENVAVARMPKRALLTPCYVAPCQPRPTLPVGKKQLIMHFYLRLKSHTTNEFAKRSYLLE